VYRNDSLKDFVCSWNNKFPIDRWWRQKHQVAFNSSVHRDSCFIDMYFEFLEDRLWEKAVRQQEKDEDPYIPGRGNFLKKREYTQKEIDEIFDRIDVSKMNENIEASKTK